MAAEIRRTIHINRPIEDVFEFLMGGENDVDWRPQVERVEFVSTDHDGGVGTVYRSTTNFYGLRETKQFEVIACEEPRLLAWTEVSAPTGPVIVDEGGYRLSSVDGGTRVLFYTRFRGRALFEWFDGISGRFTSEKMVRPMLENLKKALEAPEA